ncbi:MULTISPECIES: SDR family NAD(P)-dependent oxidoreductase [unclassified Nocardioides]|uniref:SDR family NAD(P)-dependent oxidoreductase n=1 Tax=unclassified Nocardioides TaxID=2615069 RepID=UPI0036178BAC
MTDVERYGPWAVVAGGSEGVGAEFAEQLAADGFHLVLVARKPGPLAETADAVRRHGVEVRTLALDLTERSSVDAIVEACSDVEVGLLVYNAGANSHGHEFLGGTLEGFQGVIDLNVTTPLALVHHFGAAMADRGRGGILLVGSMAGYLGSARQSVYGGVKAFGRIFAESLWLELRDRGVDVLELVLGVTRTPAMERAGLNFDAPGLRVAEPADVAAEGLAHLAGGPIRIAGGNAPAVEKRVGPDRARLVLGAHEAMTRLLPSR